MFTPKTWFMVYVIVETDIPSSKFLMHTSRATHPVEIRQK